ncbi:hypothetical protein GCM10022226_46930 [Sphaerisporangium flaviroseum]|uniref:Uncharacterized protein n=1 Tax=Sphaerisporangium flaviroseum TaxID=509199 RepID=A0ABP7ILG8_9ACTN
MWLRAAKAATRQARLADTAAPVRWLHAEIPGVGVLEVISHLRNVWIGLPSWTA